MLVTQKEVPALQDIEKLLGGRIEWIGDKPDAQAEAEDGKRRKRGGRKRGGRKTERLEEHSSADAADQASDKPVVETAAPQKSDKPETARSDSQSEQPETGRRKSRRGGRRRQQQQPSEPTVATPEYGAPAQSNEDDTDAPSRSKTSRRRELAEADAGDSTAFGMSDQVPAFLMRPIRRSSSS